MNEDGRRLLALTERMVVVRFKIGHALEPRGSGLSDPIRLFPVNDLI
jgi:hypothetical protein